MKVPVICRDDNQDTGLVSDLSKEGCTYVEYLINLNYMDIMDICLLTFMLSWPTVGLGLLFNIEAKNTTAKNLHCTYEVLPS